MQENEIDWELDPEFVKRDMLRKAGLPVEIARTDHLLLRETVDADIPELYRIGTIPEVARYIAPMQSTLEEEIAYTKAYVRHMYAFYDFGLWTVLERSSDQEHVIGRAGLFPSERLDGQIETGYMIDPGCQGIGYGKEAAEAVLKYAFDVLDLEEVHLFAEEENIASVKVAETLLSVIPGGSKEKWVQKTSELSHFWWQNQENSQPIGK